MNAVEMVLSMEQRKSQRLEGLMGEAARQYEQDMSALQQKQKWGKQGGRQGGRGQDVHVQLNAEGRYVNTAGGGGAVPFTVQAQHKARKEAEAMLKTSKAKIIHLKNTIAILLNKLKHTEINERNKATKTVSKIRQEMIFHEKRSLSEISRLTGIVDAMGNDPDIMRATMGGGVSPSLSTGVQTGVQTGAQTGVQTQVTAVARMGLGGDFVGRREAAVGASSSSSSSTHATTSLSHLNAKQHRDPHKLWASPVADHPAGMQYSTAQNQEFTNRVLLKARSEVALSDSPLHDAGGLYADEQSETMQRGVSLPHINRSPSGRRRNGGGGGGNVAQNNTSNNTSRSTRLGYTPSSMLQRLELVGDIAAEEVSPSKMSRKRRTRKKRSGVPSRSAIEAVAVVEVDAGFAELQEREQGGQPPAKSYRQLASERRGGGQGGRGSKNQNLRQMYGV
jgi:hypothetical protein